MKTFERFYKRYSERMYGYLLRKTANPHLAADILQESFTRYLEKYRDKGDTPSLLFTIGRNLVYDLTRKNQLERTYQEVQRTEPDEESIFLAREESRRLLTALQTLPDEDRDLLALAADGELSYREIATITGWTESNIKVRIHRSRRKLKHLLTTEKV